MRELNLIDVQQVSGGDFEMTVTANVDGAVAPQLAYMLSQVVSSQIVGTEQFMQVMQDAIANGANFNLVRLKTVSFSDFN